MKKEYNTNHLSIMKCKVASYFHPEKGLLFLKLPVSWDDLYFILSGSSKAHNFIRPKAATLRALEEMGVET